MTARSVIGIDFGNESCYVAVARAGGIKTIANDYSLRSTPSCVAFSGKNRIVGVAAKNQMIANMKNTIHSFKRLLGRKYIDPQVQREMQLLACKTSEQQDGSIGIHVQYFGKERVLSPEQITGMMFTKLKDISEKALQTAVNDCVISVPSYFTQAERQALLDAARIAGLNVLRLFNETTAIALCYGIHEQKLPAPEAAPRNVVFVDWGHASLQVFICAFNKGKLKMLASSADSNLGGREIDMILAEHFCEEFQTRYKIDARNNRRAYSRLLTEVEKLKKQMSADPTMLPLYIECFMDDKDVSGEMKRADMESMCANLFKRVKATLKQCLVDSKLQVADIHSVHIAGGSSRVPAIIRLIVEVFSRFALTSPNQNEYVSRGCALQCAMLRAAVPMQEFAVTDIQPYPLKLTWYDAVGGKGEMEVFGRNHAIPSSRMFTFFRSEPFSLTTSYSMPLPTYPSTYIGTFVIKDAIPTAKDEFSTVNVTVGVNSNGMLTGAAVMHIEKREPKQRGREEEEKQHREARANEPQGDDKNEKGIEKKNGIARRKLVLPVEFITCGLSQRDLGIAIEREGRMIAVDRRNHCTKVPH